MTRFSRQRGVALLIVLMIVAIVSVLGTDMASRLQLQVQRMANIKDNNQAYWYAMGAEAFARKSIGKLISETDDKISLDQPWAQEFTYPLDGGGINARLEDMQSCFNLNAVGVASADEQNKQSVTLVMEAFGRMLQAMEVESLDTYTADTVRDSLADWLDEDDRMRPYGAEDSEYESREYPYLAANSLMSAQSEIRLVNGVKAEWVNQLLPLICVIPGIDVLKINVNTLTAEHAPLLAGVTGMSRQDAASLISNRPREGWDDVQDFFAEPSVQALGLEQAQKDWFDVKTEYFLLHTKTRYNKASFAMSTVFHAPSGDNVSVLRREFGGTD